MFGQLVIGPPGSGKTTYCHGMQQFLSSIGRKVAVINLDPANDELPYQPTVDISELVTLGDVMQEAKLGPNGGLVYCIEFLDSNVQWLLDKLDSLRDHYMLIDFPGQVELYTNNTGVSNIVQALMKFGLNLCAVHLVDSNYCTDPGKFISVVLTSLTSMLHVELPFIHILSKVDLIDKQGKLTFNLDFYTEVLDLKYLLDHLSDDPFLKQFKKLNTCLVGLIEDYGLVAYIPLNIEDKENVNRVVKAVDKANGYVYGIGEERNMLAMMSSSFGSYVTSNDETTRDDEDE